MNRLTTLSTLAQGAVQESNLFTFANAEFKVGNWLFNPGLRVDYFNFGYADDLLNENGKLSENDVFLSPKFNVVYTPKNEVQFYFKSGTGFHSNDSRVVVPQNGRKTLPGAYGVDLGTNFKPSAKVWINTALWYLFLQQEFVYVGDEGIVEPSGKTLSLIHI